MTERISPSLIFSTLALSVSLFLGVAISTFNAIYAVIIAAALVAVIIALLRLDELVVTLIVAIHVLVDSYLGFAVYQIALLMALLLLIVCYFGRSADHPWTGPRWVWLWLVFLILTIIPTIEGGDFSLTNSIGYYLEVVLSPFIMFWLGNIIAKDVSPVRRVFQLLALLAVLFAIHTIVEATTGKFLFQSARAQANLLQSTTFKIEGRVSRAGSFFGNPNGNGTFLATCFFLPLGLFIESKRFWMKVIYLLEMLLILMALMFTYSNGSWLAVLAGILVFMFLAGRLRYSILLFLWIMALAVIAFTLFPSQVAVQLSHAQDRGDLSLHLASWQTATRVAEAYPLFGVGLGNQAYLIRSQPYMVPAQTKPLEEPDNSYLQWGAIAGIPVMLIFLLLLVFMFWSAWRNWLVVGTRYRSLLAGGIGALIALCIDSLTVDGWTSPTDVQYLGWLIAGLVASPLIGHYLSRRSLLVADKMAETVHIQRGEQSKARFLTGDGKRASVPATQGSATEKKQTSSGAQGYLALALEMAKSSGIYALGALASPLISLVLTPFLAHHLSVTDYGALSVLYTVVDLVTVITQLGISAAFFRAYNGDYESSRDRLGVLSTTVILLLLVSIPIAILMMITAPWLSELLFSTPSFSGPVRLTALIIVVENLTLPGISWLRAERRAIFYSAVSVTNLLVVLGTNIVLVGMLHVSLDGALIAKGAGYVVMVACTLPMMLILLARKHNLHLRSDIVRSMLLFGVPTIFSDIAAWVLQLSDRYLLSHFGSLAQTASYSVAYTLGGVLSPVLLAPWGLAWVPIMYTVAKRDDAAHIFKLVFRWWSTVLLFAAFALSLLSTLVLEALFPPAYRAAEPIIPMITLSTMFTGVWYIFMIGVNICRKTIYEFMYMLIAASVNLLLNIFFIPHFGAMGAGVSTLLAYALLVVVSYIVNQKIYPIGFEISSFSFKLVVGTALYIGSSLVAHIQKPLISWSISIIALILYGIFLMWSVGLSVNRFVIMFGYVQAALRKEWKKTPAQEPRKRE